MSQETFLYLCSELRESVERNDTIMRKAIPVEQRVAITLWFLSTNADYRTIGYLFGVSKSTVCIVTKQACAAIVKNLLPKYVRFLREEGLREVVDGFKHKLGFPQCAEQLTAPIYPSFHQTTSQLTIITTRDGIQLLCKGQRITSVDLWMWMAGSSA